MRDGLTPSYLRCAKIKLTSRCNLRCRMCKYWRTEGEEELTTGDVIRAIKSLHGLGCRKVHFSGGEVFLRDDLLEIVDYATSLGLKVNLTTNGTLIRKSTATRLIKSKVNSISFSLDGADAKLHDRIRGMKGAYRRIIRGIGHIAEAKSAMKGRTKIRVNVVLQRENYRVIPEIVEQAGALGAVDVKAIPVDGKCEGKAILSKSQIREFNDVVALQVIEARKRYGFSTASHITFPLGKKKAEINLAKEARYALGYYEDHLCFAPWLHTFISWNGDVFLCCMSRGRIPPLGNVRHESPEEIFRGARYNEVRNAIRQKRFEFCSRCDDFLEENRFLEQQVREEEGRH